jgi:hypothetical protein
MKKHLLSLVLLAVVLPCAILLSACGGIPAEHEIAGKWEKDHITTIASIDFQTNGNVKVVELNTTEFGFTVSGDVITINDSLGKFEYTYKIEDGKLVLTAKSTELLAGKYAGKWKRPA